MKKLENFKKQLFEKELLPAMLMKIRGGKYAYTMSCCTVSNPNDGNGGNRDCEDTDSDSNPA